MGFKTVGRYDDNEDYTGFFNGPAFARKKLEERFDEMEKLVRGWSKDERINAGRNVVYSFVEFIDTKFNSPVYTPQQFVMTFIACATELGFAGLDPLPKAKMNEVAEILEVIGDKDAILDNDQFFDWKQFRDKDHQMLVDNFFGICPEPLLQEYPLWLLTYMLVVCCADKVNENGIKAARKVWIDYLDVLDKRKRNPNYEYTGTYDRSHFRSAQMQKRYEEEQQRKQEEDRKRREAEAERRRKEEERRKREAEEAAREAKEQEEARKDAVYREAAKYAQSADIETVERAVSMFQSLSGWKDSDMQAVSAAKKREDRLAAAAEAERLERLRKEELERQAAEEREKQRKKRRVIGIPVVVVCTVFLIILTTVIVPNSKYTKAAELYVEGNLEEALAVFEKLGSFKDSSVRAEEISERLEQERIYQQKKSKYDYAVSLLNRKSFKDAEVAFAELNDFEDSAEMAQEANYQYWLALYQVWNTHYSEVDFSHVFVVDQSNLNAEFPEIEVTEESAAIKKSLDKTWAQFSSDRIWFIYSDSAPFAVSVPYLEYIETGFSELGDYKDAKTILSDWKEMLIAQAEVLPSIDPWSDLYDYTSISAATTYTVGLKSDGTVLATNYNGEYDYGQCDVSDWTDIVSVSAKSQSTIGLKSDGTVVATGDNEDGQCDVSDWTDIIAISTGGRYTLGLRADGTVVATEYKGDPKYNRGQWNVDDWNNIIAISAGGSASVGLKADGTVVATGVNEHGQCNVSDWTDIVAISAGASHTVGLKADGTVVAVGYNHDGECNVSGWTDIVAISAGDWLTVGLKADGTVVATGRNGGGACDVSDWTDIVAISAAFHNTVGIKADGTAVSTKFRGDQKYHYGQCDVSNWTNIKVPE